MSLALYCGRCERPTQDPQTRECPVCGCSHVRRPRTFRDVIAEKLRVGDEVYMREFHRRAADA